MFEEAGRVAVVPSMNLSTSSKKSVQSFTGLATGARKSVLAVYKSFPGTYVTV